MMTGEEHQQLVLPKGRTIPINGDVVRTLRIQNKLSIETLATMSDMSPDRLIEIEKGGQKVFPPNFLAIAEALGLKDWKPLHQVADSGEVRVEPGKALQEKRIRSIKISFGENSKFDLSTSRDVIEKILEQVISSEHDVIVVEVTKGSIIVEVELSEADLLRLITAFSEARLDAIHVDAIRLPATTGPLAAGLLQIIQPSDTPADEMTDPTTPEMTLTRTPMKTLAFSVEETKPETTKIEDEKKRIKLILSICMMIILTSTTVAFIYVIYLPELENVIVKPKYLWIFASVLLVSLIVFCFVIVYIMNMLKRIGRNKS
jgi:transcriptional regulator with XRE-family HTH domain